MGMGMLAILQLLKLCVIGCALVVRGSTDSNISPSPATFYLSPPIEGTPGPDHHRKSWRSSAPISLSQPDAFNYLLSDSNISPSPATFYSSPPIEGTPGPDQHRKSWRSSAPSSMSQPNGSDSHDPPPPPTSAPVPQMIQWLVPSLSTSTPTVSPSYRTAPPPLNVLGNVPSMPPSAPKGKIPVIKTPVAMPVAAPVATPTQNLSHNSPSSSQRNTPVNKIPASLPVTAPVPVAAPSQNLPQHAPSAPQIKTPVNKAPISKPVAASVPVASPSQNLPSAPPWKAPVEKSPVSMPVTAPVPVATPSTNLPRNSPISPPSMPGTLSPSSHQRNAVDNMAPIPEPVTPDHPSVPEISPFPLPAPAISPSSELPENSPTIHPVMPGKSPSILPDPDASPASTPPQSIGWQRDRVPEAAPPHELPTPVPIVDHSSAQSPSPIVAPSTHTDMRHNNAPAPSLLSPKVPSHKGHHSPAPSPSTSMFKHHRTRNKNSSPAPASLYPFSPPTSKQQGPGISPALVPVAEQAHYAPPPLKPGSSVPQSQYPFPSPMSNVSPAPSLPPKAASGHTKGKVSSPNVSPGSSAKSPKIPLLPPLQAFPPPPPNLDCSATICTEPYTNTPPNAPCACVLPMQVGLRLSVALYTFFPLVSELAKEIATGVFMKQSQVRIIGANAASQQPEKTIVLIDLVPLGDKFDNPTALLTFQRFWHKQVVIKASYFGDYEVLYVRYPGLPLSPPSPTGITIIDGGPYPGLDNNARANKPLGVDVRKNRHKDGLNGGIIAIIALSASVAVVLCFAVAWVLLFKHRNHVPVSTPQAMPPSLIKPSGLGGSLTGSGPSSVSLSFGSSIAPYTGSAKTFSTSYIEKATDNLDVSRVLGEGGFGRVYSGVLEDGTKVAVKVLKRADQQGGREFLAEVEMLSRLHHRNLVKLIGICTEERTRCLVYELIPNGSVESHLHGIDKETAPLNWASRVKIALGAARGLAYLHEDSSPRVIHRDFKSSNILLEHDFTPKVSDFGLARAALDEENRHISTRVMGTFGYVAPEYAMTGHLLVKSDVYSYGVVLLELLTGRKPVDMSQPPGQENLVAWARPLLTSKEGLETIIDTSLGSDVSFDSIAKVAAIASMCVQPEVSHRPFMGEVVQALKLVCNECDDARAGSKSSSHEDLSIDMDTGVSTGSGHIPDPLLSQYSVPNFNSGIDTERGLSVSDLFSSARFGRQESGSFRRYSSSGPLRMGRGGHFWEKIRRLSGGSVSEHGGATFRLWPGSH
ncbi:receptor-like serine/threonine-protein kinase ALE2 [Juglans microcarpa x Juglans regia]|uniref:receptor-like serine/threonine-protein kinase ALE2 n=1 Tax=Juglans microcarpa x Juglans regia TaxID=2249226 RepID=UPI001B7EDDE6|nr:receptor-like serine/threonine-protein kinase ALE2 [Juglans microcarpa x Juglans regia]